MKPILRMLTPVLAIAFLASSAFAAMEVTGVARLRTGTNVVAGVAANDSPGSSDLTLIIQIDIDGTIVFDEGDPITAIMPTANIPSDADPIGWAQPDFDDSGWITGQNGIGYGDGDDNLVIGDGDHATVYMRGKFNVSDAGSVKTLTLGVDYDDGCVILINGEEVARTSGTDIATPPTFDSWTDQGSGQSHEASKQDPPAYETVVIPVELATAVEPAGKLATAWAALKR